jgi:hypothetical protein
MTFPRLFHQLASRDRTTLQNTLRVHHRTRIYSGIFKTLCLRMTSSAATHEKVFPTDDATIPLKYAL